MHHTLIAYQAVPPANGQESTQAAPPSDDSSDSAAPGGSSMLMFLMFIPLLIFMFWQSRSQQKKQETAIAGLKKGDRVVTQSGLVGRLLETDTRYAKLELAPGVKVQVLRSSLTGKDADEATSSSPAKETEKKS